MGLELGKIQARMKYKHKNKARLRKNRRASHALFFFCLRQAKVVDGIHRNNCIRHGIVSGGPRFRLRLAEEAEEV